MKKFDAISKRSLATECEDSDEGNMGNDNNSTTLVPYTPTALAIIPGADTNIGLLQEQIVEEMTKHVKVFRANVVLLKRGRS